MQKSIEKSVVAGNIQVDKKKVGFVMLESLFITALFLIISLGNVNLPIPQWAWPILFVLATFRTARTLSFNEIAEPLRSGFTEVKQDSCGAGANVHPKGDGMQYVVGSLLSCPICTGTWAALALVAAWVAYEPLGKVLVLVLGFAGGSEIAHWTMEFAEWGGRLFRVSSGAISPDEE